ncbi:MAG: 1-deoxy-D-xylulose-5-phosphate synthase [Candidatus Nanopelagicales bacterium]|nr:1-deoxy-D-xylulose-5-phosphate synthase [Candidatus Nanopelagicales bacterium]
MSILNGVESPADLRTLTPGQLDLLAIEIRASLVDYVTRTGGHLGPNLGVVELTLALHLVFDSPKDPILWDTGHQTYVHKMITGRTGDFDSLRQEGGLSGYPSRAESIHDVIENSHASTALSYADGIAKAFEIHGESDRHVVAVVGDGALTGGMTWEALNNIADGSDRSIVIVVNDNERSYSPTIGGMARHLAMLRTNRGYEKFLGWGKSVLGRTPVVGAPIYDALHGMKKGIKDFLAPQGLFEDLGLKYIGPVDGHNVSDMKFALQRARDFGAPVIVHVITEKGRGYKPAESDEADRFHAVGIVDPDTGKPLTQSAKSWTSVFSEELVAIGSQRQDLVAITAAMLGPTGLDAFAEKFPTRTFDVGIAEQHAVTSAVGMAHAGLHPVIAIYSTFLNRAVDQVIMDCALHKAGVTFALDRSGVTGDDGASHNGMWDMALLRVVPNLDLFAPRDGQQLKSALRNSVAKSDHPTVIRFSKGAVPADIPAVTQLGFADVLLAAEQPEVTIVAIGVMATQSLEAAKSLQDQGFRVEVIDPIQVLPISPDLIDYLSTREFVVTIEDGLVDGGIGEAIGSALRNINSRTRVLSLGIPKQFLDHATRKSILNKLHLDAQGISEAIARGLKATVI